MLSEFFLNDKGQLPSFIESVDDFPHLKIVKLRGNIDSLTLGDIQKFVKRARQKSGILNKSVLLDLRKVEHVDTAAVAQLLKVFSDLKEKKYKLGMINAPELLRHMIGILKLEDVFLTFESQNTAFSQILSWSKDWN